VTRLLLTFIVLLGTGNILFSQSLEKPSKAISLEQYENEYYTVAEGYRKLGLFKKSLPYYREVIRSTSPDFLAIAYPNLKLNIGEALFLNGDMEPSKRYLNEFITENSGSKYEDEKRKATRILKSIAFSQLNNKENTKQKSLVTYSDDDILLSINVDIANNQLISHRLRKTGTPFTIIEERVLKEDSIHVEPTLSLIDGIVIDGQYSTDGLRYYFTKCQNGCNIFLKEFDPLALTKNYQNITPFVITKNGVDYIYYSSNRIGGKGGFDIYTSARMPNGAFTEAHNIGGAINSKGNELFPTIQNRNMIVSSNGRVGFGGYDMYKATPNPAGWTPLKNMGVTVNSSYDEFKFFNTTDGEIILSDRGEPSLEAFQFVSNSSNNDEKGLTFSGEIKNNETKNAVKGISVSIYEASLNSATRRFYRRVYTDSEGMFKTVLPLGKIYKININKSGFKSTEFEVPTFNSKDGDILNKKLDLNVQKPTIKGSVLDYNSGAPVEGAEAILYEIPITGNRRVLEKIQIPANGKYEVIVPGAGNYMIAALKDNYLFDKIELSPSFTEGNLIVQADPIKLISLSPGNILRLNKLQFIPKTSGLKDASFFDLFEITELMREHSSINLAIYARPARVNGAKDEFEGAYQRAYSVGEYLNLQRIPAERIKIKGYDHKIFQLPQTPKDRDIILLIE